MIDQDQIRRARQTNLVQYLMSKGYSLRREPGKGENFRLVGYQGLIVQKNHFFRFGGREKGNAIDFLVQIEGMTFPQAVEELLGYAAIPEVKSVQEQRKSFELPAAAANNKRIINYLKNRGIPEQMIKVLIPSGLIYQDQRGNCVFPCYDTSGRARGAFLRGTTNVRWVGVANGSDVSYPWVLKLQEGEDSITVVESPIDAMSFLVKYPHTRGYIIALGGLREKSINRFLTEHPEVSKLLLATDNDQAGRDFAIEQYRKCVQYEVEILHPPAGKDWNDFLLSAPLFIT